ncbi:MAG: ATP-binding cassette domain-containing protein [Rhodoplanes sp.]|jgi:branched-chain amino acid transport system ATP-binding protein
MSATLDIRGLNVDIAGSPVLNDVALSIAQSAFVGLIGRNGAGKTTLMRAIMGLLAVRAGTMTFVDQDLRSVAPQRRAGLGIGYMPEDRRLVPELTVEENVLLPAWANKEPAIKDRLDFVYTILPEVRVFAARRASQLSGGQQKLVALARALTCGRRLLLCDEPFEGVAPALARRIVEAIAALRATGVSVLLSESDYVHSADLIDTLYVIERGVVTSSNAKQ